MKKRDKIPSSQITPESVFFMKRRKLLKLLKLLGVGVSGIALSSVVKADLFSWFGNPP